MDEAALSSDISRVRRAPIPALVLLACAACSDEVGFLSLSGLESSIVVLARLGPDARVIDAKLIDPASSASYFDGEPEDTIHAFALDRALVQDAAGRALDDEQRAALSVAHGEPAATRCSVCPVPASSPPFVLEPGSRCALPAFAEHRQLGFDSAPPALSAEQLDSLRAELRIERPGECGCLSERTGTVRGSFSACDVEPGPKPHRWDHVAVSDDGAIAAVHPSTILTATIGAEPIFHALSSTFVRSPTLTAIRGRRFFSVGRVVSTFPDIPETNFFELDGDAIENFDPIGEVDDLPQAAVFDPARSAAFLLGREGRVYRCGEDLAHCERSDLPVCSPNVPVRRDLSNAALLPSGDIIAVTSEGHLFQLRAGSDAWECRLGDLAFVRREGPLGQVETLSESLVAGDRLFACGHGSTNSDAPDDLYAMVLSAELSLAEPRWHAGEITVHVEEVFEPRCQGLWHDRQNNEVLAFYFRERGTVVLAFDLSGNFLGRRDEARFPGIDEPIALVAESPDRRTRVIAGSHGGLYVDRDAGGLTAIGPQPVNQPSFAIARREDVLLLGGGASPRSWDGGCERTSVVSRAPLELASALDAATVLFDGRALVLTTDEVAIYDPATGISDRFAIDLPALSAAAAITATEVVLLDTSGAAHVLSLEQKNLRPLVLWSEPGIAGDRPLRFRHLAGANGVGWLSGGLELVRLRQGPSGVIGELWWGAQLHDALAAAPEPFEVDNYGAAAILCAGRTSIFVRGILRAIDGPIYLARTLLLEPSSLAHDYALRILPGFSDQARFGTESFDDFANVVSAGENPVFSFGTGLVLRPDSEPWHAPNPEHTSIVERGDQVVLTDRAGLTVFLRSP